MPRSDNKFIKIYLDDELIETIDKLAEKESLSRSSFCRKVLIKYIAELALKQADSLRF